MIQVAQMWLTGSTEEEGRRESGRADVGVWALKWGYGRRRKPRKVSSFKGRVGTPSPQGNHVDSPARAATDGLRIP